MKIEIRKTRSSGGPQRDVYELFGNGVELGLALDSEADAKEAVRIAKHALKIAGSTAATVRVFTNERARTLHLQVNGEDVYQTADSQDAVDKCQGLRNIVHDVLHFAGVELRQ